MSGAGDETGFKWTLGVRVIANQIDRARWRNTLTYRFHPRLTAGAEYNPLAGKVSPLANFVALTETHRRPALILGTSSDRIGTPSGQSYYATLSKNIKHHTGLPLAPYFGVGPSLPATVIVGRDGRVLYATAKEVTEEELKKQLDQLIAAEERRAGREVAEAKRRAPAASSVPS